VTAPGGSGDVALLLVDDREENLLALEAVLEPLGHVMVRAGSGEEALRQLLTREFAVIVLDVQMPGLDGFETAAEIKQRDRTRDIPIIFLTAMSREPEHRMRGFETGAVDYIFKPVEPDLLRAKVNVFVDLYVKNRQLKEQRRALAEKTAELERSNADLEQFSYIASHDLQEPLRVVAGYLELLGDRLDGQLDDTSRDWVDRINAAAVRMSALLSDLLVYARAGAGAPVSVPVDLDRALAAALDNLAVAIGESGATVTTRPMGSALATSTEVIQVFQNLVGNAVKFSGDAPVTITVDAEREGDVVRVAVHDNGRGVPDGDLDRLFGMFERLDGEPFPGTGLGLAVCRKLVDRLGGRIWMERNDGPGVTVRFTLPACEVATVEPRRRRKASAS
jgi:signal transduction histidine kinase